MEAKVNVQPLDPPEPAPEPTIAVKLRENARHFAPDGRAYLLDEEFEVPLSQYRAFGDKFVPMDPKQAGKILAERDLNIAPGSTQRVQDASSKTPDHSANPGLNTTVMPFTALEIAALKTLVQEQVAVNDARGKLSGRDDVPVPQPQAVPQPELQPEQPKAQPAAKPAPPKSDSK